MAKKKEKRFVKIHSESGGLTCPSTYILVDKQTGVNYLYAASGYSGSLTALLNRDGTPVISRLPIEEDEI